MARQLDILALEPFFGGPRRSMLETLVRCSRHRWTVLKLPPRRIERRLTVAANWFAEQLSRHWVGNFDLLFTSEALNLASLYQLVPVLANRPSVVYFHSNQLPSSHSPVVQPTDLVNLNTAASATEIWFNSRHHLRTFLTRAAALVERHPELASHNPVHAITKKVRLMIPPVDTGLVNEIRSAGRFERKPKTIFVETRDADVSLLNSALGMMDVRGYKFDLVTVGPVDGLSEDFERRALPEADERAHVQAMFESGVVLSVKPAAASDFPVIRAIAAGCRPVLPFGGVYPEIIPEPLHPVCLYDVEPDALATRLQVALTPEVVSRQDEIRKGLKPFDPIAACRAFDARIEELTATAAATRAR